MDGTQIADIERKSERTRAASIAHEINNPLESVLNLLCLVERDPSLSPSARHYLRMAEAEVRCIAQIATSALSGLRNQDSPTKVNVPQLLSSVIEVYRSRIQERGISLATRYCAAGDLPVYAASLRQLFSNLLLNAAQATPIGGRLHARVCAAQEWSGQRRQGLRITFADNGSGIPADIRNEIFRPFFTTKGKGSGNGLGLSLVQDVVQEHGGSLRVRSSTRQGHSGSVFMVFLPAPSA
jgi:two-component system, NtrC family, sensor kinase